VGVGGHHGQIHKDAGQVKQARKPTGHENNVKRFDPQHAFQCSGCHGTNSIQNHFADAPKKSPTKRSGCKAE
jgi:hypothetical protein